MHAERRRRRSRAQGERGAAAVEFGLLLPLVLLIVCGIIDFGGVLNAQVTLTQAAREGARVAALQDPYDYNEIEQRTKDAATSRLLNRDDVGVSPTSTCPDSADAVVSVSYPFEFITPIGSLVTLFGGDGFGNSIDLSATGVMPCEATS